MVKDADSASKLGKLENEHIARNAFLGVKQETSKLGAQDSKLAS